MIAYFGDSSSVKRLIDNGLTPNIGKTYKTLLFFGLVANTLGRMLLHHFATRFLLCKKAGSLIGDNNSKG